MAEININQKLVHETRPSYNIEEDNPEYVEVTNFVLKNMFTEEQLNDPKFIDFINTYNYEISDDHYFRYEDKYDVVSIFTRKITLAVSNIAKITVEHVTDRSTIDHTPRVSQICLSINGTTLKFGPNANVQEIHKVAMIYSYVMEQLDKIPVKDAYGSKYHLLKLDLEDHLNRLANGKPTNLDVNKILTPEEMEYCESVAKATALKQYLINRDIIPQESRSKKYPTTYKELVEFSRKVEAKYIALKAKNLAIRRQKEYKALVKAKNKELRLAKIKERKLRAEQRKQQREARRKEKEAQRKSVRDTSFEQ